jgi:aldehyde dehydrogenase (NAD+)
MTMQLDPHTDIASIAGTVKRLRATYNTRKTRPLEWRRNQLQQMVAMLEENEDAFIEALRLDLGKPMVEGFITDLAFTTSEIALMLKNLKKWNKVEKVRTPLVALPAKSVRIPEPIGVVCVIAPWNYPVQLLLVPAAGAIAAGNTVVLKPSEVTPHVSAVLARLIPQYMDNDAVALIEGGVPETTELLAQKFDHIFYTGNGKIGRVVMAAAAVNLTPVTLELGGKSPVIIDKSANIKVAARRVAWGKWLNAGQTCIAPDYVLVDETVQDKFVDALRTSLIDFYGENPHTSDSYGRIVSPRHFDRLLHLMTGGTAIIGGESAAADRYIAPTVLGNINIDAPIMQEEIFGPLLPIIPVKNTAEAISFITSRDHPLALYVFAEDKDVVNTVLSNTTAGGVTVNGTLLHITSPHLPFGGIGESGLGAYHGKSGVRIFQHMKPVLKRGTRLDPQLAYPPYTDRKFKIFRKVL